MGISLAAVLLSVLPQDTLRIEARIVDLEGQGIAGVTLTPDYYPNAQTQPSGPDGLVAFEVTGKVGKSLRLSADHPQRPKRTWMLLEPESAAKHDLGTLVLPPGGTVTGWVVDANGDRQPGNWSVQIRGRVETRENAKLQDATTTASGRVNPDTGEFRVEGVAVGPVTVSANHPGLHLGTPEVEAVVEPEVETFVEVLYHGPNPSRCVRVEVGLAGPAPPSMAPVEISVMDALGNETTASINLRRSGSQRVFVDVGTPPFTVSHSDGRFVAGSHDVGGGEHCDLTLVGSCTYRLSLVEARTRRPLPRAGLTLIRGVERTPILAANSAIGMPHELPGIFPGEELTFELALPGRPPLVVAAPTPRNGVVPWSLSVDPPRTLQLELVDAQGRPCPNVEVQVTQGTTAGTTMSPYKLNGLLIPGVDHVVTSDAAGRVNLRGLHATAHTIRAYFGPCLVHEDTLSSDQLDRPRRITEPAHGELSIEVLLPDLARPAARGGRLKLRVHSKGRLQHAGVAEFDLRDPRCLVDLPPGEVAFLGSLTSPNTQRGRTWELTTTRVRVGEARTLQIDLRETCPGTVNFAVTVNGRTERSKFAGTVAAHYADREEPIAFDSLLNPELRSILAPGEYHFDLRAEDGAWAIDERLTVEPGDHVERILDFAIHTRPLELRDAQTGQPLAGRSVTLRRTRYEHTWDQVATSDDEGRATLRLVAGEVEVRVDGCESRSIHVEGGEGALVVKLSPGSLQD